MALHAKNIHLTCDLIVMVIDFSLLYHMSISIIVSVTRLKLPLTLKQKLNRTSSFPYV